MKNKAKVAVDVTNSFDKIRSFIVKDFIENDYTVREGLIIIGCIAGDIIIRTSITGEDPEEFKQALFTAVERYLKG